LSVGAQCFTRWVGFTPFAPPRALNQRQHFAPRPGTCGDTPACRGRLQRGEHVVRIGGVCAGQVGDAVFCDQVTQFCQ
jgi:hypothetical protein